jgi:hypothetical protein
VVHDLSRELSAHDQTLSPRAQDLRLNLSVRDPTQATFHQDLPPATPARVLLAVQVQGLATVLLHLVVFSVMSAVALLHSGTAIVEAPAAAALEAALVAPVAVGQVEAIAEAVVAVVVVAEVVAGANFARYMP